MEQGGKYNMLNVAVSRAQYHFLVFGNMNIFHPERNTPVGNLAKWLFDDPANEVSGNFIYRQNGTALPLPAGRTFIDIGGTHRFVAASL